MANNDNSIIERIRGGETSEFAQLVKRYGPSLMVFVGRIVGVQEDTEDVVQNTFVAAYQHLNDYDPQKASLPTWLQRAVLINKACRVWQHGTLSYLIPYYFQ